MTDIHYAASQAWVGFWQTCMADVGARSLLDCDETVVANALNGSQVAEIAPTQSSELAQRLQGDGRIADITVRDVLVGLEDYFQLFRKVRRVHPEAYKYFSRIGAPVVLEKSAVHRSAVLDPKPIVNPHELPAFIGVFFADTPENFRDEVINDKPTLLDFHLFEKRRRNIAVAVPPTWTIYDHSTFSLEREGGFTKAERKRHRLARGPWGFHYFIGIDPNGIVHALPMHMDRKQVLKTGEVVHHRNFTIPPGLFEIAKNRHTSVHDWAATMFAVIRSFCATALSGVQLSVRRGDEVCRFGVPLSNAKAFFRDRDRVGRRRPSMLHYVGEYQYERNGRAVTVGEHLRGVRRFSWRNYDITITVPGIHAPLPEALVAEALMDDDILPVPKDVVPVSEVAKIMQRKIERAPSVPFRRGKPTRRYHTPSLQIS